MAQTLRFLHLSLSVSNLGRSTEWYQDVLGLEIAGEVTGRDFRRRRLKAANGDVVVALTCHDQRWSDRFDEHRYGMDHVAFLLEGSGAVERLHARCAQLGVNTSEVKIVDTGLAMITLRDPDNIQLEVFAEADPQRREGHVHE
jgi:glyoxylase I family protein